MRLALAAAVGLCLAAASAASAQADVFNGRIAFTSFRAEPPAGAARTGDVFTMTPGGGDLRRLTESPEDDAQSDWAPDGRDIAYRIRKPGFTVNFEVARMTAAGEDHRRLTFTPAGEAASQPAWYPDRSAIVFRRSAGGAAGIWRMGPLGEDPELRYDPPGAQWYPTLSPDMGEVLFATTVSPAGDADRAIQVLDAGGAGLRTLFDVAGAYDSAPAWAPDGRRIAFESNADVGGANPEGDMEVWVMAADGSRPTQLTHNALHDEGPAWSPDGTMLAYASGPDNTHLDIHVMSAAGVHLRRLTDDEGRDESPDWQAIPAPDSDRRCGSADGARDVRAAGRALSCRKALRLAARWAEGREDGVAAAVTDFGGTLRVLLTPRCGGGGLVAFLAEP
jgi:TolB protein